MKTVYLLIVAVTLSACAANKTSPTAAAPNAEFAESIRAFEAVCLKTAPSFSGAAQAAARFGITDIMDAGFMKMGFNKDQSLGVQITANKECVITSPSQRDGSLTGQFLQTIGRYSAVPVATKVPTRLDINGVPFIFQHDRKGGEAFVILKENN